MLVKSPAIVLGSVKYGDSSIILKTYTKEEGIKSFIAGGLQKKGGVLKPALVQPLSQLQVVYYGRSKGDLKRLKEASVAGSYQNLFYDPVKSSLALFLAEVLSHVLHEEEPNYGLYDYLSKSLFSLDQLQKGVGNFHLHFLFRLTGFLGFKPEECKGSPLYFDLLNGGYVQQEPPHHHFTDLVLTPYWILLQLLKDENLQSLKLSRPMREKLLNALLEYYRLHVKDFGRLRSLDILRDLLS